MVVVLKYGVSLEDAQAIRRMIMDRYPGLDDVKISAGKEMTTLQLIGDERGIRPEDIGGISGVERYSPVSKPYKLASRDFHPEDTVIKVGKVKIGREFVVMAGPCSVDENVAEIAKGVKDAGAKILRGGAYKPRSSPYSYQGMREKGLVLLAEAGTKAGLPVITEVMDAEDIERILASGVDILQVGMRNARNYSLLKELSQCGKPVLLKRGDSSKFDEWLMAGEYLLAGKENGGGEHVGGNPNVMLCERGIVGFDPRFRNTMDINAIAEAKKESHLPVIADPSHGTGRRHLVVPVGLAAVAAGADGLLVEAHYDPGLATSDGAQTIGLKDLGKLVRAGEEIYKSRLGW
jgi:3-deoxy-7-phosphoheptulonate synthase